MSRSDAPGDSLGSNAAHLFRHLGEASALRLNPIVREFFQNALEGSPSEQEAAVIVAIRERILRVCELQRKRDHAANPGLAERYYAIVVRCDLYGEARKSVARDLGISLRHFCRERRAARERIAHLLIEELNRPHLRVVDRHRAAVARAMMFAELGRDGDAIREFHRLAANAESVHDRFQALTGLAAVERDWGRLDAARAVLDTAAGEVQHSIASSSERLISQSMLLLARTELAAEQGETAISQRGFAELGLVLPHVLSLDIAGAAETVVSILRAQTLDAFERGARNEVLEHAANGLEVLASAALPPPVRMDFLHAQVLALYDTGMIDQIAVRTRLLELLRSSQSSGYLSQAAKLFCSLGYVSPPQESRVYLSTATDVAHEHGAHAIQRNVSLTLSAAAAQAGDYTQAATELNRSQDHGAGTSLQRIIAAYVRGLLLQAEGRNAAAIGVLSDAYNTAKTIGNDRARGALLRSMASIQIKSGDRAEARGLIEASLPIIEHHGSHLSLQLALEIYEQLSELKTTPVARFTETA